MPGLVGRIGHDAISFTLIFLLGWPAGLPIADGFAVATLALGCAPRTSREREPGSLIGDKARDGWKTGRPPATPADWPEVPSSHCCRARPCMRRSV